jgi:hypothetical protein
VLCLRQRPKDDSCYFILAQLFGIGTDCWSSITPESKVGMSAAQSYIDGVVGRPLLIFRDKHTTPPARCNVIDNAAGLVSGPLIESGDNLGPRY